VFVVIVFFVLLLLPADTTGVRWGRSIFFLVGAGFSALTGFTGMSLCVRGNVRVAAAARDGGEQRAMRIAFRTGGVAGMFTVGLGLFGAAIVVLLYKGNAPQVLEGFGFGAALLALFMRVGGGIYTKAADVGADLVGKVEAGIPEDDPRNPAVIADLVGDNVGDCAGRGADLFESTAAENIGAMILGAGLATANPTAFGATAALGVMLFPLVARAFGLVASIVGIMIVRSREDEDPMRALNRGYWLTAFLAGVGFLVAARWLLNPAAAPDAWWHFFLCGTIGVVTSIAFVYITQYYTEYRYRPVKSIAAASVTGPATNIIAGFAIALECTALPTFAIGTAIIASYRLGASSGLAHSGLFGTAVATMGMLGTAAYILAMDTFGPITDNAGGVIEMSHQPEDIRRRTDRLDAVGNTTKALTKGYAIGSAALAAFLLFSAYLDEVAALGSPLAGVDISKPEVFVGGLLGAMLVFWFSALAIGAVMRAAVSVIKEVRRQFQADPGILKGTSKPDYGRAVDIVTVGALKEMVAPGLLAVGMPIAVGLVFKLFHVGAESVAAFLMVGTIGGILLATSLNNGGGAWDNAKKLIETGEYGGKGGLPHKAAVVGDTVGDPFKDTAGPSLHVLIKLLSTVTLVLAPLFV
jgi:K(+)-stimulated pyrophosphate-energized sodium pump